MMTADEVAGLLRTDPALPSESVAEIIRTLKTAFEASTDRDGRREALSEQIGAAADPALRVALRHARDEFDARTVANSIRDIESAATRSEQEGWNAWLEAFTTAVVAFRPRAALVLVDHPIASSAGHEAIVPDLRRAMLCMIQARWDEVDHEIAFLAAQNTLPPGLRAKALTIQAQLELWRFLERARAEQLLDQAYALAPSDHVVLTTLGDLYLEQGNSSGATEKYERARDVAPRESNGYVGLGEQAEKESRQEEAEKWYRLAITRAGRDATGFDRLLRLLIRTGAWRTNPHEFNELLARRNALDPDGDYDTYLMVGDTCKEVASAGEHKDWYLEQARSWYERACQSREEWPRAYASLADFFKEQGDAAQAEAFGRRCVDVDPECPAGFLFLGRLFEEQQRWADMADIYGRFPARPHRWKLYARTCVARARAAQGDREEAHQQLLDVLREESATDREQVFARTALEDLADSCYRTHGDAALAQRIFDELLQNGGDRYRARYHDLVGNMYTHRSDHQAAAAHYREAIGANGSEASYHRHLSDSLRSLFKFDEARSEIERAFQLDRDDVLRRDRLGTLENTRGNRAFEQGAYRDAIACYARAIEQEPHIAVYYSNTARAYELLNEPGMRAAHMAQARAWFGKAQEITRDRRFADRIERLHRREQRAAAYGEQAIDWVSVATPIVVDVASDLVPLVSGPTATKLSVDVENEIAALRESLSASLGVSIPGIRFRGSDGLPPGNYVIGINDVPAVVGTVSLDRRFFEGAARELQDIGATGDPAADPLTGLPGLWIRKDDWHALESRADSRLWTVTRYMLRHIEAVVRRHLPDIVGHQDVVARLSQATDPVCSEIKASSPMVTALTNVCRALLAEGVSIKSFEPLCRTFKEQHADSVRPRDIVERIRLLPGIRDILPGREGRAYLRAGERFEEEIRHSLYRHSRRMVLAMAPDRCQAALAAVRDAVSSAGQQALTLVVADPAVRPFVRKLVELEFPDLAVLSAAEARDDVPFLPARIDLDLTALPAHQGLGTEGGGKRTNVPTGANGSDAAGVKTAAPSESPQVSVTVPAGTVARQSPADDAPLQSLLTLMQEGLFHELGMLTPEASLREDPSLPTPSFLIQLNGGEPVQITGLSPDEYLVNDTVEHLQLFGVQAVAATNPGTGSAAAIATNADVTAPRCRAARLSTWGPAGYIVLHLSSHIRTNAPAFQTDEATRHLLDSIETAFPDLVRLAVERFGLPVIAQVLRHLVAEGISIKDLRAILEGLLCLDGSSDVDQSRFIVFAANAEPVAFDVLGRESTELPPSMLAGYVRTCLKRYISHKYTRGSSTLLVYLLDPRIEDRLRNTARPLTPEERRSLTDAVKEEIGTEQAHAGAVLLTGIEVRATLRDALRDSVPQLPVLSYQELSPELNISPVARIYWNLPEK